MSYLRPYGYQIGCLLPRILYGASHDPTFILVDENQTVVQLFAPTNLNLFAMLLFVPCRILQKVR